MDLFALMPFCLKCLIAGVLACFFHAMNSSLIDKIVPANSVVLDEACRGSLDALCGGAWDSTIYLVKAERETRKK